MVYDKPTYNHAAAGPSNELLGFKPAELRFARDDLMEAVNDAPERDQDSCAHVYHGPEQYLG